MHLLFPLLGFRSLEAGRALRQNAFALFVLGPLILGGALLIASRYLDLVRTPLRTYAALLPELGSPGPLGLAVALALIVIHLPGFLDELFHRQSALDALPVGEGTRFAVAVMASWGRLWTSAAVLLLALAVLGDTTAPRSLLGWGFGLAAALLPLALGGIVAASLRVRFLALGAAFGATGRGLLAALLWLLLILAVAVPRLAPWLLLPLWPSAALLEALLGSALLGTPLLPGLAVLVEGSTATLALGLAAGFLAVRYRRRDLERAARLARRPRAGRLAARLLERRRVAAVLLGRDLLLVARRFSPAVDLTAALAGLGLAMIVLVLPGFDLPLTALLRLGVLATVASTLALLTLVPLLVEHQLPRFWSERTSATAPEDVSLAKLWLARCLALPPAILGAVALALLPGALDPPGALAMALVQLVVAEWIVASVVGHTVFEIAEQPLLGIVFGSLSGLAIAALFVLYPRGWWLWLAFYLVLASKLAERAAERVKMTEARR